MRISSLLLCSSLSLSVVAQQERLKNLNVGDIAPEIAMLDPNGDTLRLSELRGKVVLVDFWASWCHPCRLDNPNVVNTFKKYKDLFYTRGNGFAVFSVSLDRQGGAAQWKNAIAADSLNWKWHVGAVTNGNNTAATTYGVAFIPTNVLIDGEGRVIAKDVHGEALFEALNSLTESDPVKIDAMRKARVSASSATPAEPIPAEKPKRKKKAKQ